ncbi:MAG: alpha/beta hydrolase [Chloroflexota bacterium]|nr:MAG: alpha/beta hydrolase [Chloroflexota bacterium]
MTKQGKEYRLELQKVIAGPVIDGVQEMTLVTDSGPIHCRFHPTKPCNQAILWVGGAGGGLDGPAGGLYARLAERMASKGIASLRLDYRRPNQLLECTLDTLIGIAYLESVGCESIVLVGHSFGGAVVISAAVNSDSVVGVTALSSQTYGTNQVSEMGYRSLLLIHGGNDRVLPDICSREIYQRAGQPKKLIIYPGCGHGLDECREELDRDLSSWLGQVLLGESTQG